MIFPDHIEDAAGLGKLGLRLSLVAPAVFLAFMVLRPG